MLLLHQIGQTEVQHHTEARALKILDLIIINLPPGSTTVVFPASWKSRSKKYRHLNSKNDITDFSKICNEKYHFKTDDITI